MSISIEQMWRNLATERSERERLRAIKDAVPVVPAPIVAMRLLPEWHEEPVIGPHLVPDAAVSFAERAGEAGGTVRLTHAHGPHLDAQGRFSRMVTSVAVRARWDAPRQGVVATWVDGAFEAAWLSTAGLILTANSAEAKAAIDVAGMGDLIMCQQRNALHAKIAFASGDLVNMTRRMGGSRPPKNGAERIEKQRAVRDEARAELRKHDEECETCLGIVTSL